MTGEFQDDLYVVSPYLETVPGEIADGLFCFLEGIELPLPGVSVSPGVREILENREKLMGQARDGTLAVVIDRRVKMRLYIMSREEMRLLERMRGEPGAVRELAESQPGVFRRFAAGGVLVPEIEVYKSHNYRRIEIEINRHCNYRCRYCPVAVTPRPAAFMAEDTYILVLERVKEYGAPTVSLNHYSEPTLDPGLVNKIRRAVRMGLSVDFNTNASLLDEKQIKEIAAVGNTVFLVNLPTVDRDEYRRLTGSALFDKVIANLHLLHKYRVPTRLAVNRPYESNEDSINKINEMFSGMFGEQEGWPTDNRAGQLENPDYGFPAAHAGRIAGCSLALYQLNVDWEGRAFLCCQDYNQEYILGDLRRQSIKEIARDQRVTRIRKWIFGGEVPPANFICTRCDWTESLGTGNRLLTVGRRDKFSVNYEDNENVLRFLLSLSMTWL